MREHGLLMTEDNVRLIKAPGLKIETRRLVTPHNSVAATRWNQPDFSQARAERGPHPVSGADSPCWLVPDRYAAEEPVRIFPRIQPGDGIWIKEGFRKTLNGKNVYRSDVPEAERHDGKYYWRNAMFMGRQHARLVLPVVHVAAERIQEIDVDGARREGMRCLDCGTPACGCIASYRRVWDAINSRDGHGWARNEAVWVYRWEAVTV